MATDMDLTCSESSSDITGELDSPSTSVQYTKYVQPIPRRLMGRLEAEEELENLVKTEQRTLIKASSQIAEGALPRRHLVEMISAASKTLNFSLTTESLAVNLMDRYISNTLHMPVSGFPLVAVCCLYIAAKMEEVFSPPSSSEMQYAFFNFLPYRIEDVKQMELAILSYLGWKVLGVTAANALEPVIGILALQELPLAPCDITYLVPVIRDSAELLLAETLKESFYQQYLPSSVASAAIYTVLDMLEDSAKCKLTSSTWTIGKFFSPAHMAEICECRLHMKQNFDGMLRSLWVSEMKTGVETAEYKQWGLGFLSESGAETPTSVLQNSRFP